MDIDKHRHPLSADYTLPAAPLIVILADAEFHAAHPGTPQIQFYSVKSEPCCSVWIDNDELAAFRIWPHHAKQNIQLTPLVGTPQNMILLPTEQGRSKLVQGLALEVHRLSGPPYQNTDQVFYTEAEGITLPHDIDQFLNQDHTLITYDDMLDTLSR